MKRTKKNNEGITACIRNSGFSAKSKVCAFNKSRCKTESEVLFNPLLLIAEEPLCLTLKDNTTDNKQTEMPTLRKIKRAVSHPASQPKTAHLILPQRTARNK